MARPPVRREDVGYIESAVKRLGAGMTQIAGGVAGFGEGAAEFAGLEAVSDNLGALSDIFEDKSHEWIQSVGGTQTFYEGDDSLKAKWDKGNLSAIDVGRAVSDLAFSQAPQFAFGGAAAKAGRFALSPLIAKALPTLGKKSTALLASQLGSTAGIAAQETGSIYGEQEDKDFLKALGYGTAAGGLESASLLFGASKAGLGKYLAGEGADVGVRTAKQIAKDVLKSTAAEASTEFAQTGLEQLGADKDLNLDEMIEAGIGGAVLGGGIPAVTSPVTNRLAKIEAEKLKRVKAVEEEYDQKWKTFVAEEEEKVKAAPVSMLDDAPTLDESLNAVDMAAAQKRHDLEKQVAMDAAEQASRELEKSAVPQDPYHPVEEEIAATVGEDVHEVRKAGSVFYETSKNFVDWSKQMVQRFGKIAKGALLRLWEYVKRIQPGLSVDDTGRKGLSRNFIGEIRASGGLTDSTIAQFMDKRGEKTDRGGSSLISLKRKTGLSLDQMAQSMLEKGWNIPVDEYGKADAQAFAEMIDEHFRGAEIIHADDAQVVADQMQREGDIDVSALEDELRTLGSEKVKLRQSKAKTAPAKLEALKEQEADLKKQIADAKEMQAAMSEEPVYEDEVAPVEVAPKEGINISSYESGLGKKLTNFAQTPITYKGKRYATSEAAYQAEKKNLKDLSDESVYNLMVDVISEKLKQHKNLVDEIDEKGGADFLASSRHDLLRGGRIVKQDRWTGQDGLFMKALRQAYADIKTSKEATPAKVVNLTGVQAVKDAASRGEGINVLRLPDTKEHFGNPFSPLDKSAAAVKVKDTQSAVNAYAAWLMGKKHQEVEPERRAWIVEQIQSGALDGQTLLYYKDLKKSHAAALAYLINNKDLLPTKQEDTGLYETEPQYAEEPDFEDEPAPMTDNQYDQFYTEMTGLLKQEGLDEEQNARLAELQGMLKIDDEAITRIKESFTAAPVERKAKQKKEEPKKREKLYGADVKFGEEDFEAVSVDNAILNAFYPTEGLAPEVSYETEVAAIAEEYAVPESYVWNRIAEMREEGQAAQSKRVQSERDKQREENLLTLETKGALKGRRLGKGAATGKEKPPLKPEEKTIITEKPVRYTDETGEVITVPQGETLSIAEANRIAESVSTENLAVGKEKVSAKELFHESEFEKQRREEQSGELEVTSFEFEASDVFEHFEDDMDTGVAKGKAHASPATIRQVPPWQKQLFAYAKTKFKSIRMFESYLSDTLEKLSGNTLIRKSKSPSATQKDIDAADKFWHESLRKAAKKFLDNNQKAIQKASQELYEGIFTTDVLSDEYLETYVSYRDGKLQEVTEAGTLADIIIADLQSIEKQFNIPKLLNYVMQQEGIASLSDLKAYPESLHEFMDFTATMDSVNPFSLEDTETESDITATRIANRAYVQEAIMEFGGITELTEAILKFNRGGDERATLSVTENAIIRDLQEMFGEDPSLWESAEKGMDIAERDKRVQEALNNYAERDKAIQQKHKVVGKAQKEIVKATSPLAPNTKAAVIANWVQFMTAVAEYAQSFPKDGSGRKKPFNAEAVLEYMLRERKRAMAFRQVTENFLDLEKEEQLKAVKYMYASTVFDSSIDKAKRDLSNAINDTFRAVRTRKEFLADGTFTGTAENVEVGQSKGSMYEQPYHQVDSFYDQISGKGAILVDKDGNLVTNEWATEASEVINMALEKGVLEKIEQEKGWPKGKYIDWLYNLYESAYPTAMSETQLLRQARDIRRNLYSIPQEKALYKSLKWKDKENQTEITEDVLFKHIADVDKGTVAWGFTIPREVVMSNLRTVFRIQREKREELAKVQTQAKQAGRISAQREEKGDTVDYSKRSTVATELARIRGELVSLQANNQETITSEYINKLINDYPELNLTKDDVLEMAAHVYYDRTRLRQALNRTLENHRLTLKSGMFNTLESKARSGQEFTVEEARKLVTIGLNPDEVAQYKDFAKGKRDNLDSVQKKHYSALFRYESALRSNTHFEESLAQEKDYSGIPYQLHEMVREKKNLTAFESQLVEENHELTVVKLDSKIAQGFYNLVAKVFGADLSIVSSEHYRSRYIGESSVDGRPKIVVNLKRGTSFHRIFAHELFHHIVNKANPVAYERFKQSIIEIVGQEEFAKLAHRLAPETTRLVETDRSSLVFRGQLNTIEGSPNVVRVLKSGTRYERRKVKDYIVGEEEALAELYAEVMHDKGFYTLLAKTFEGKLLSQRLILRLLGGLNSIGEIQTEVDSWRVENRLLINSEGMKKVRDLTLDLIAAGEKDLQHNETRYHTVAGYVSESELIQANQEKYGWLKGIWKTVFPEGSKGKKDMMSALEKLVIMGIHQIRKLKPTGIFADLGVDPAQVTIMTKIAHAAEFEMNKAKYQVTNKYKHVFKQYTKADLETIHDIFVRRGVDVGTTSKPDKQGAKMALKMLNKAGFVKADTTQAQIQDIINTFRAYKEVSDGIWDKLKVIYPDLGEITTHYGQSIKWRRKDGIAMDDEFDWVVLPEKSQLEGSKQFLKEMNLKDSTREIAEKYKLEYDTIDPHALFLTYVRDANRLLQVKASTDEMLKTKGKDGKFIAKIYKIEDQVQAAKDGYVPVDDNALKIIKKINLPNEFVVETLAPDLETGEYKVATSKRFSTEEDAKSFQLDIEENNAAFGGNLETRLVESSKEQEVITSHWNIIGVNKLTGKETTYEKDFKDEADAREQLEKLREKFGGNFTYILKPIVATPTDAQVSQLFFRKDTARMFNVLLSPDPLRNMKIIPGKFSGQNVMNIKNAMTSVEFALSGFHAMTIGQEIAASHASWAQKKKKGFSWQKIPLVNMMSLGGKGTGAWKQAEQISMLMEAMMGEPDLQSNPAIQAEAERLLGVSDVDIMDIIKQFHYAGGMLHQDVDLRAKSHKLGSMKYRNEIDDPVKILGGKVFYETGKVNLGAISQSFKDVFTDSIKNEDPRIKAMFNVGQFAALESTTAWLMEYMIPRAKMAMWMREYTHRLEINQHKIDQGLMSKEWIARDTMKFIEDRFGEVNWKNMWMKPSFKTALQFTFRSFTWFMGSWLALSKAGIDMGKWGWFKVKGEQYELTEKGLWGINAFISHIMAVGMITIGYNLFTIGQPEVPEDEETPLLTRLLFPRADKLDPEARLTVPSYITEAYKIMRHLGVIGNEAEYAKLISGRTNSLMSNFIEVLKGEDWRGVSITDHNDSLPKRAFDSMVHIFGVLPISVSTIYSQWKRKGTEAITPMALGVFGFTDAPAAAKRSDATNKAFEIRRQEYKGKEITPEEMTEKDDMRRAAYAYRVGNKEPLLKMQREGKVSRRQMKVMIERMPLIDGVKNPLYKDPLSQALKGLTIKGAMEVWDYMSLNERAKHRYEIVKKFNNMMSRQDHPLETKKEVREMMRERTIL